MIATSRPATEASQNTVLAEGTYSLLIAAWRTLGVSIDPRKQVCKAAAFEELHDDVGVPGSVGAIDLDQQRSEPVDRGRSVH